MPDLWPLIIPAIIGALFGSGGTGILIALYRAKTERQDQGAQAKDLDEKATEAVAKAWERYAQARADESKELRERLVAVETTLADTVTRLERTEMLLQRERKRTYQLLVKVDRLEREREELLERIQELEVKE